MAGGLALGMASAARADRCANDAAVAAARAAAEAQCHCALAANHGDYVRCVSDAANALVDASALPKECKGRVTSCAAHSTCGKPDAVTCCRTDRRGKTKCSIKNSADKCRAPRGGSATPGGAGSCCDGCGGGSTTTAPPTTTTAAPTTTVAPTTTTSTTVIGSPSQAFVIE
jgi:hypothetical protein